MPRRLVFSDAAIADLSRMRAWYSQPGAGPAAHRTILAIIDGIKQLEQWPQLGRTLTDGSGDHLYVIRGHTVAYHPTGSEVIVLRVWGPGEDRPRR